MNNIQAILLAAGRSSRMYPFAGFYHKSMIEIMGKPILFYTIEALKKKGISDLLIVVDKENKIKEYFGDGKKFGVSIRYVVQNGAYGMGDALLCCKDYIKGNFILVSASHVDIGDFVSDLLNEKKKNVKAVLLAKRKKEGVTEGVLRFLGRNVQGIVEKPKKELAPSDMHVVGIYLFEKDFLETLSETEKEHYSLEKAISNYASKNEVYFIETSKETVSLKYPWDLLNVKDYLFKKMKRSISQDSKIAKSAKIIGDVIIEKGVEIMEGARIKGPCFIGKNVKIGDNAVLRNKVDIEGNSVVGGFMEVKNAVLMSGSTTHSGFMGDSVVGENCKIAAQFCTANVRLDRKIIKSKVKNEEIETGRKYLGAVIGEGAQIGIKSSTMPGIIIGRNVLVGPSTVVMNNVPDNTKYYTKFQEIVIKKNEE